MLITGAAGGVGAALAEAFAEAGWDVFGQDLRLPGRDLPVTEFATFDLADDSVRNEWVARVSSGGLQAIVNNAAEQPPGGVADASSAQWARVLHVNLAVPSLIVGAALSALSGGSAVVNISSVHAMATTGGRVTYAASKAGLIGLTRSLAMELAPKIRVNAILPGAVDTPLLRTGLADIGMRLDEITARIPARRVGQPSEIAKAALFLADSRRSGYITGQTLTVDGGVLAALSSE